MENQGWAYFTTLFTPVDPYREFRHTDLGFYQVLARVCEQRQGSCTTTTSFLHWLISVLLLLKIFTLEQTFLLFANI